jgi:pyridoxal 5'-phosphate synthase pdxT subunit
LYSGLNIGILCMQGAFREHRASLESLNANVTEVRKREHLENLDGIILPGGESTAIGKLLNQFELMEPLREKISGGLPVWGTCAGMILLAKSIENDDRRHIDVMDISVVRNGYGRQLGSFGVEQVVPAVSEKPVPLVFIRAPYISSVGDGVEVVCKVDDNIVAARQNNMLAVSFHPELTPDTSFLEYFLDMCKNPS